MVMAKSSLSIDRKIGIKIHEANPGFWAHAWNPSTETVEAERSGDQVQAHLHSKFETSMYSTHKTVKQNKTEQNKTQIHVARKFSNDSIPL